MCNEEKCSIVIMDNCGIHYSERVFNAIRRKRRNCDVFAVCKFCCTYELNEFFYLFFSLYSPDMNPIEEAFAVGKAWLKRTSLL